MKPIFLTRDVNSRIRYIKLKIYQTLFIDTFIVVQEFGSITNSKPTGVIKKFFKNIDDAHLYIQNYTIKKQNKGYK